MHFIRLMYEGIELMTTGRLTFPPPVKDLLLSIHKGEWSKEKVEELYKQLESEFITSESSSPLPPRIDRERVSAIVSHAYLSHWVVRGLI